MTTRTEPRTLYRAAADDSIGTGTSFAESRATAGGYRSNPGFGGTRIYSAEIEACDVLDLRGMTVADAAEMLGQGDPGAIGIDEWLPRDVDALATARATGALWALVDESYPRDTTTWIWLGTSDDYCEGREPELVEVAS
jgi:hypothetical protein